VGEEALALAAVIQSDPACEEEMPPKPEPYTA